MKIKFEFDTDSENFDAIELEMYKCAPDMARCLGDIHNKLRSWSKYDERSVIPVDEISNDIYEIFNDNYIDLEKIGY